MTALFEAVEGFSGYIPENASPYCSAKKDYEKDCAPPVTIGVQQWPHGNVRIEGSAICIGGKLVRLL